MAGFDDVLQERIDRITEDVFISTKAQYTDYFERQYPGKDKAGNALWKPHAAMHLAETTDKKSTAYKSAMRNFQERGTVKNPRNTSTSKWIDAGKQLPPLGKKLTKQGDITITVKGTQSRGGYKGKERTRTYEITLSSSDAYSFVNGDITLQRLGDEFYGFDFTEDSGDDTSSGETDIVSVSVS